MERATDVLIVLADAESGDVCTRSACWTEHVRASPTTASASTRVSGQRVVLWSPAVFSDRALSAWRTWTGELLAGLSFELVSGSESLPIGESGGHGWETSRMLLEASRAAVARGIWRVVWPVRRGAEASISSSVERGMIADRIADASDRALLVSRLIALDCPQGDFAIETPYVDLSVLQVRQLAADMDMPERLIVA